jgi:hypothetical protein
VCLSLPLRAERLALWRVLVRGRRSSQGPRAAGRGKAARAERTEAVAVEDDRASRERKRTGGPHRLARVSESEPFYVPSPEMFGHADAYRMYTTYAAELEQAGLADRFPAEADVQRVTIELLAERHFVEIVKDDPDLIDEAIAEARRILNERRNP